MAGVSIATVSYVINGKTEQKIPEETRKKVFHAINFLGYSPNPHAVAIKTEHTKDIILRSQVSSSLLQDLENISFLQRFTPYCIKEGYSVALSADKRPMRVPASACVCLAMDAKEFHTLAQENFVPLVAVDTLVYDPVFYQVTYDYAAIRLIAQERFGSDFTYVAVYPEDAALREEILSCIPNTLFVRQFSDFKELHVKNAVVTDHCPEMFLHADSLLVLSDLQERKLAAVLDCVKRAVTRITVADSEHYIKV